MLFRTSTVARSKSVISNARSNLEHPTGHWEMSAMRRPLFDNARGLGILLVVFGHAWPGDSLPVKLIYSFHMPLFFLISGALVKKSSLSASLPECVLKQARSLLIPFLFFGLISTAQWVALGAVSGTSGPPRDLGVSHLFGVLIRGSGREMRDVNGTLWFFTCLFVTSIYYHLLRKSAGPRTAVVISGVLAILTAIRHTTGSQPLPWNLDLACVGLLFYAVGHAAFVPSPEERSPLPGWQKVALICLLAAAGLASGVMNARVDMRGMIFGDFLLFCGSAFALSFALLLISAVLPKTWLLTGLSVNSITIFPLHLSVIALLRIAVLKANLLDRQTDTPYWLGALVGLISIAVCWPVGVLLSRYAPVLIGGRKLPPAGGPHRLTPHDRIGKSPIPAGGSPGENENASRSDGPAPRMKPNRFV